MLCSLQALIYLSILKKGDHKSKVNLSIQKKSCDSF